MLTEFKTSMEFYRRAHEAYPNPKTNGWDDEYLATDYVPIYGQKNQAVIEGFQGGTGGWHSPQNYRCLVSSRYEQQRTTSAEYVRIPPHNLVYALGEAVGPLKEWVARDFTEITYYLLYHTSCWKGSEADYWQSYDKAYLRQLCQKLYLPRSR